ncbi:fatty acid/sphingolipid desaturase [Penicillium angulare]|uniref:fatty acid/sphingolipid desaturase n=1 Tax=Penicillium angulare TaxID=116970 RepID=UPI002541E5CF|nr:fatty acid/sphingolipid desaturase [Penicillium angulare]KAJ5292227.1 fatty acid/sphingolipid desaturase [Penicillium angulare]
MPPIQRGISPVDLKPTSTSLKTKATSLYAQGAANANLRPLDPFRSRHTEATRFLDFLTREEIDLDLTKYPPVDKTTQTGITRKYRLLHEEIRLSGLYECNYISYVWEAMRCALLISLTWLFMKMEVYWISAAFLGLFWSQLVFIAHDAGHMGITHNFTIDTLIAMIIAAPIGGLSMGWWKSSHNVHHIVTNSPEHDPDNQHLPLLAVNHRFLGSLFSTYHERWMHFGRIAKFWIPYQVKMYYVVLAFGRFNLYAQSWLFLIRGQGPRKGAAWWHRWFEILGIITFCLWYGYGLVYSSIPDNWNRFTFVMISHMVNMPLHVQFTLSHFAMSAMDLGNDESFAQKMLRTTMDIDCPEWLDFFHGGLQFQAVHHLFPRIPRHNLRSTQKLVQKFCRETGIPYALYGFVDGNKEVLDRLSVVGRQATILAECQRAVASDQRYFVS